MSFKTDPLIPTSKWIPEPRAIVRHEHYLARHKVWEQERDRLLHETMTAAAKAIAAYRGGWAYDASRHADDYDRWHRLWVEVSQQAPRFAGQKVAS